MSAIYKWINPPIKFLLASPLHGIMSSNTLLLDFTGRKSGRALSTPISYYLRDGAAHCFTSQSFRWWRNLTNGQTVTLTIAGKEYQSVPEVVTDDTARMERELDGFLRAIPRDAGPSGVKLDGSGNPNQSDIKRAVLGMAFLKFELELAA
jgi:hypothetical protein